jgi:hypothetical protein
VSTRNIRAVLKWAGQGDAPPELADALAEVEAITKAARDLTEWHKPGPVDDVNELRRHARMGNEGFALLAAIARESGQ